MNLLYTGHALFSPSAIRSAGIRSRITNPNH